MADKDSRGISMGSSETRRISVALVVTLCIYALYTGDFMTKDAMSSLQAFIHLTAASALFGMQAWVSFFGGVALFRSLPRKYFGKAQSAQFPVYFKFGLFLSLFLLFSMLLSHPPSSASRSDIFQVLALLVQVCCLCVSNFYIVPVGRKKQMAMHAMEGASAEKSIGSDVPEEIKSKPGYMEIRKEFGKLHGFSVLLNLFSILIVTIHLFYLSRGLKL